MVMDGYMVGGGPEGETKKGYSRLSPAPSALPLGVGEAGA